MREVHFPHDQGGAFLAFDGKTEVANITYRHHDERVIYIAHVVVLPSHQKLGLASSLFDALLSEFPDTEVVAANVATDSGDAWFAAQQRRHPELLWELD